MSHWFAGFRWLLVLATVVASTTPAWSALYSFELPDLLGTYQNAQRDVSLQLGTSFRRIDGVTLQLVGSQQVGSYSDLNFPGSFPYPAELMGTLPELVYPVVTGFDEVLPPPSGNFDVALPLVRWLQPHLGTDFSPLLDGQAEFRFAAFGPPLIATTYVTSFPQVTVNAATLHVVGEASASRLPGDYDGDGDVDYDDYHVWRDAFGSNDWRADGNGNGVVDAADYSLWRDHVGSGGAGGSVGSTTTPEPSTLVLAMIAWMMVPLVRSTARKPTAAA